MMARKPTDNYICAVCGKKLRAQAAVGYLKVEISPKRGVKSVASVSVGVPPTCNSKLCIDRLWVAIRSGRITDVETL